MAEERLSALYHERTFYSKDRDRIMSWVVGEVTDTLKDDAEYSKSLNGVQAKADPSE